MTSHSASSSLKSFQKSATLASIANHDGFGLLGVVLLLLLTTIAAMVLYGSMQSATSTKSMAITVSRVAALRVSLAAYVKSHGGISVGTYPPSLTALVTTDGTSCTAINDPTQTATFHTLQGWCGPYIDKVYAQTAPDYMNDGWEQPFVFSSSTGVITSCGPDQICGDGDDITFSP